MGMSVSVFIVPLCVRVQNIPANSESFITSKQCSGEQG